MSNPRRDLLGIFAHHKVAANLLMTIMLLAGLLGLDRMNVQFFPTFALDLVTVSVIWTGASSEDVEEGITSPLEQRLRTLDNLRKMTSTSTQGVASISLEFREGSDPLLALDQTRRLVDEFRNLPGDAETPRVVSINRYEPVARVLVTGLDDPRELRQLVRRFETELLRAGIDKMDISGLPEEEIAIQLDPVSLEQLGISLDQISERVGAFSRDQPAGVLGRAEGAKELRSLEQRRDPLQFGQLPLITEQQSYIDLGAVSTIERKPRDGEVLLTMDGRQVAEMSLKRTEGGDSLKAAEVLGGWLEKTLPTLPPGVAIKVYDESWHLIRDRIMLLLKNGGGGLVLVILILYIFLTGRVAFWVAVGIPVSFMATLAILWFAGGSINMISLFALIMALGIIVDDAIVVGEDALAHYQMGEPPLLAAEGGARRMLAPVVASSLTTIAAFLPLMLVGGIIGNILFAIPLVIVSVILASLVESFFVLPGHLRHSFMQMHRVSPGSLRAKLDRGFVWFRETLFRPLVRTALAYRGTTISIALSSLVLAVGLLIGGRLTFLFFPTPEAEMIYANVAMVAGTPRHQVDQFLEHIEAALYQTERELGVGELINVAIAHHGSRAGDGHVGGVARGDHLGALQVELLPPDRRSVRNKEFIEAWRSHIEIPAGVEGFTITSRQAGPPGRDLTVRLTGSDPGTLKQAALSLAEALNSIPGVSEVEDDLAYGREQLIYSLNPQGAVEGLTLAELGRQMRTAFDGRLVQIFQDGPEEVEVRVRLKEQDRASTGTLYRLNIRLPDGDQVPLTSVADWESRRGFEILRHAEGRLAVEVTADVDTGRANPDRIISALERDTLPEIANRYGISYSQEGRSADQRETLGDMKKGVVLGLVLIYLVLAWVFASYGWPLVVMTAIPFGLVGALFGHWLMGLDLTILSLFGLFALSGIVVNDSIILVTFYQRLRGEGMKPSDALEEAACQRLRAVLLTSMTTIAGLTPLLFETSLQAQFLIPMATSIAFGLAFATLLILLFVPALLSVYEGVAERLGASKAVPGNRLGSTAPDYPRHRD
ncbi:MAG: efflux RND transporter permease subunit [Gammaproteobacteria bacterium]|nr:efflux RND transporter permease subunit [Gammaproteobacteria bacterium]